MKKLSAFLVIFVILFSGCSGFGKKYVIGIDPTFYPANLGGQADNVYGFMVDLLEEISKTEGVRISYKQIGSESVLNGLQRNAYDAILTPKSNVLVERNIYSVSEPAFLTGPVLVTMEGSETDELSHMEGKIVGVLNQSDAQLLVQKYPQIFIFTYSSPSLVMEALKYSLIDGALLDVLVAQAFVQNLYNGMFKIVSKPLNSEGLYLVTMVNQDPLLIEIFNSGLNRMKKRGTYNKLLEKWNLYPESPVEK